MICEKKYQELHVSLRCTCSTSLNKAHKELCSGISFNFRPQIKFISTSFFIDKNIIYLQKAGSSAIALESCYMFTKKVVNMFTVLDMILIGLMIMYDQEY